MTMGNIGHQPKPLQWINEGWMALKDSAHSAITHFTSGKEEEANEAAETNGSWGVLAADIVGGEKEFEARFELPGMEKKDIEVSVQNGRIVVEGEKHVSDQFRKGDLLVTERAFGRFQRAVALPGAVEADKATATYKNGVLIVQVPRRQEANDGGKIPVQ